MSELLTHFESHQATVALTSGELHVRLRYQHKQQPQASCQEQLPARNASLTKHRRVACDFYIHAEFLLDLVQNRLCESRAVFAGAPDLQGSTSNLSERTVKHTSNRRVCL